MVAALKEAATAEALAVATAAELVVHNNSHVTKQLAIAGASIATGNHATTIHAAVNIAPNIPIKDAADKYLSTISNNAAVGYHSTTAKHAADIAHNTTIHAIANTAQNITINVIANTFHNTTTNEYANHKIMPAAQQLAGAQVEAAQAATNQREIISPVDCDRQRANLPVVLM